VAPLPTLRQWTAEETEHFAQLRQAALTAQEDLRAAIVADQDLDFGYESVQGLQAAARATPSAK